MNTPCEMISEMDGLGETGQNLFVIVTEQEAGVRRVDADESALGISRIVELL